MEIVFIGSGNVATNLGLAFKAKGLTIKQVYSQNPKNAETLANKLDCDFISDISEVYMNADIYFYALKDSVLRTILRKIDMPRGIQVHTGGSIEMSEFEGLTPQFGVFYPVQTFSVDKPVDFSTIPICIEACNMDIQKKLLDLAGLISEKTYLINSSQRKKIHLAAVFACNFSNYMYDISSKILEDSGISFEIIQPLILETAEKIKTLTPYAAQTGPAVRNDLKTISKHISLLNRNSEFRKIYRLLTKSISKRHKRVR
jgi:predicted short-subunit dehydrogenase-like oxidoreductase (DUF2520 family)